MIRGLARSIGTPRGACRAALAIVVSWSAPAAAQENSFVGAMQRFVNSLPFSGSKPPPGPNANLAAPSGAAPRPVPGGQSLMPPPPIPPASIPSGPASLVSAPAAPAAPTSLTPPQSPAVTAAPPVSNHVALSLSARYGRDVAQPINGGLVWRIYPARPGVTGVFRSVREERSPSPMLMLPPGDYVVHASFGLASAARTVRLRESAREVFELPAGGIRIEGRVGDVPIPAGQISFDVFQGSQFELGEKNPVAQGVMTGDVVVLPEGTYHIVSNYGDTNAVVRSDIRVQVGKLTDITVTHRAAVIMLKLVGEPGGEALANTSWTVLTPGGDVIKESIGAFPKVVLAEGDYRAIARNEGKTFERDFKVTTGVDGEVELVAR